LLGGRAVVGSGRRLMLNFYFASIIFFQSAQHLTEKSEGSGAKSVPLTNGSRSRRPKNMLILIPNTALIKKKRKFSSYIKKFRRPPHI
jgi:hypothetical protein